MSGEVNFSNGSSMQISELYVSAPKKGLEDAFKQVIAQAPQTFGDNSDYIVFQKDNKVFTAVGTGDLTNVNTNMSFVVNGEEIKPEGKVHIINNSNTESEYKIEKKDNILGGVASTVAFSAIGGGSLFVVDAIMCGVTITSKRAGILGAAIGFGIGALATLSATFSNYHPTIKSESTEALRAAGTLHKIDASAKPTEAK